MQLSSLISWIAVKMKRSPISASFAPNMSWPKRQGGSITSISYTGLNQESFVHLSACKKQHFSLEEYMMRNVCLTKDRLSLKQSKMLMWKRACLPALWHCPCVYFNICKEYIEARWSNLSRAAMMLSICSLCYMMQSNYILNIHQNVNNWWCL